MIPGLGRSLERGMATHSSILAWRIHGQRNLVGYSAWGHIEFSMTEATYFNLTMIQQSHSWAYIQTKI